MMEWQTSDMLPGMMVRVRQFNTYAHWWCITIWNGLDDEHAREWECIERGKSEQEAMSKAADELRQLAR